MEKLKFLRMDMNTFYSIFKRFINGGQLTKNVELISPYLVTKEKTEFLRDQSEFLRGRYPIKIL